MTFRLVVDTDGAAFHPIDSSFPVPEGDELERILSEVGKRVAGGERVGIVLDLNGNRCGTFELERKS